MREARLSPDRQSPIAAGEMNAAHNNGEMIMKTMMSLALALSVLAAVAAPASAGYPDPRNSAVEVPYPSPN
jgi:hypothetical protein